MKKVEIKIGPNDRVCTVVGCIDFRSNLVLQDFCRKNKLGHPDMINRPGMIKRVANKDGFEEILSEVKISLGHHASQTIIVAAHDRCAGNPVDVETHKKQIMGAVLNMKKVKFGSPVRIMGAFVFPKEGKKIGRDWTVDVLFDSDQKNR